MLKLPCIEDFVHEKGRDSYLPYMYSHLKDEDTLFQANVFVPFCVKYV